MAIDKNCEPGATGDHRPSNLVAHQVSKRAHLDNLGLQNQQKIHCILCCTPRIIEFLELGGSGGVNPPHLVQR